MTKETKNYIPPLILLVIGLLVFGIGSLVGAEQESIRIERPFPVTVFFDSENEPYIRIVTDWARIGVREIIIFNDTDDQAWQLTEVPRETFPIEPRYIFDINHGGPHSFTVLIRADAGLAEIRGITLYYEE